MKQWSEIIRNVFQRMPWADAMKYYGSDKPDLRFGMKFVELMDIMKGHKVPLVWIQLSMVRPPAYFCCSSITRL